MIVSKTSSKTGNLLEKLSKCRSLDLRRVEKSFWNTLNSLLISSHKAILPKWSLAHQSTWKIWVPTPPNNSTIKTRTNPLMNSQKWCRRTTPRTNNKNKSFKSSKMSTTTWCRTFKSNKINSTLTTCSNKTTRIIRTWKTKTVKIKTLMMWTICRTNKFAWLRTLHTTLIITFTRITFPILKGNSLWSSRMTVASPLLRL
jgi:hypothetical protein